MKISKRNNNEDNLRLFVSGIITIFIWKGVWTLIDDYIGFKQVNNILLLVFSIIALYLINGKIELY